MATTNNTSQMPARVPRWIWIVLVASLALNLLVAGMAAAAIFHFKRGHTDFTERYLGFAQGLPADRQAPFKLLLEDQRKKLEPLRHQARQARRQAREAFAAETFDRAKLAQAYASAAAARREMATLRAAWLEEVGTLLTAGERKEFLNLRRRGGHHRWRGPKE